MEYPDSQAPKLLAVCPITIDTDVDHLDRVALFPHRRNELDFIEAVKARAIGGSTNSGDIDKTVAYHAAAAHVLFQRGQPIAQMETDDPSSRALDFVTKVRVPPDVIDIDDDAEAFAERVA